MKNWMPEQWCNTGASLIRDDVALARRLLNHSVQLMPVKSIAWYNLGLALHQQRRIPAAIRAYRHALALPDAPVEHIMNNLSQDLLLASLFEDGWQAYEHRLKNPMQDNSYFETNFGAAWSGPSDARTCKKLILVAEQGYGDTLQFLRLALHLQKKGIEISLFCQSALIPLLREQSDLNEVVDKCTASKFTSETLWCPLMSLAERLRIGTKNIPLAQGYIHRSRSRERLWRKKLKRKKGHRLIALHWQGNEEHEQKLYSLGRSFAFDKLLGLKELRNTEFIAIQKGKGLYQLRLNEGLSFVKGQDIFDKTMDFRDTAAVLNNCDLLISSDSGVVHLAGAMGIPCWVALRWIPEWRWGLFGSSTPWYRSIRLFRQEKQGDWESVFENMKKELEE
tara:strand:+ start:3280 stop:4458 length:1179 start_codon:yes stop_codon:yes gene_type:complete